MNNAVSNFKKHDINPFLNYPLKDKYINTLVKLSSIPQYIVQYALDILPERVRYILTNQLTNSGRVYRLEKVCQTC